MFLLAIYFDARRVGVCLVMYTLGNTLQSQLAVLPSRFVGNILSARGFAQIVNPVIQAIPVNMVDIVRGPLAMNVHPRETVSGDMSLVNAYIPIMSAALMGASSASNLPDHFRVYRWMLIRVIVPSEYSSVWVVVKRLLHFSLRKINIFRSHFDTLLSSWLVGTVLQHRSHDFINQAAASQ